MTQSLHFYTSGKSVIEWDWNNPPLGLIMRIKQPPPPDKDKVKEHIDRVKQECLARIDDRKDTILAEEKAYPWVGRTFLDRIIYSLRHTTYHGGDLPRAGADKTGPTRGSSYGNIR
jgi:hypothetical protein